MGRWFFLVTACVIAGFVLAGHATPKVRADEETGKVLLLINEYRSSIGAGALRIDPKLTDTAEWMANDLAAYNRFSHTDSQGRDFAQRLKTFGVGDNVWRGENLFAGLATAKEALEAWKNSPGHNENMVRKEFTKIGIARVFREGTTYGWYWVTEFSSDEPVPAPTAPAPTATPMLTPTATPTPPTPQTPPPIPAPTAPAFCVLLGNTRGDSPLLFQNPSTKKLCSVF